MGAASRFPFDADEPLGLVRRAVAPAETHADLRAFDFEFASRGDRVPGQLLLPPEGDGPFPLLLLQHAATRPADAPYLEPTAGRWARGGAAVASIDLPLHGQRASTKLTERLLSGFYAPSNRSEDAEKLVREFLHQAVVDLCRALDALERSPEIDGKRVAYAGFRLGTIVGASFCALDPRPQAAAFAIGGSGVGPTEIDPARAVGRFAPRPSLFVNATRDEVFSRESALALFDAGGEPKEMLWFEGSHAEFPGEALEAMWRFLKRHLGVP